MENPIGLRRADDGTATVTVRGEIDFSNADEVARRISDAVADWSPPTVYVDLADAAFIDSTGLGALIEGYRTAAERGSAFVVLNPNASFRRVLAVTGLADLFGLGAESDDAEERDAAPDLAI